MNKARWPGLLMACLLVLGVLMLAGCQPAQEAETLPEPTEAPAEQVQPVDTERVAEERRIQTGDERLRRVAISPDGDLVATGQYLAVQLWNLANGSLVGTIEQRHSVEDLAFSPDGTMLAAGLTLYGVHLSSAADGMETTQLGSGFDNRVAFAPGGQTLASGNREGVVYLWDVDSGEQIDEWAVPDPDNVTALAFSPDGSLLAVGHMDGYVRIWNTGDGTLADSLEPGSDYCTADGLAFSPDGQFLAVAGAQRDFDRIVRVWNVAEGSIHQELDMDRAPSNAVAYSPDGELLAASATDGIRVWDATDGSLLEMLQILDEENEVVWTSDVAFAPDGQSLAAAMRNGDLVIWSIQR